MELRVEFAARHLNKLDELKLTIYTDEKKFSLDGPTAASITGTTCGTSERSIPAMSWRRVREDLGIQQTIEESNRQSGRSLGLFQQDNASVHRSGEAMEFIKNLDAGTMKRPARSPDLNPIENVWDVLVRSVYANGRQFTTRAELKYEIEICWRELDQQYLRRLIEGLPTRMAQVILQWDKTTDK
uniref:PREDICTED: similar to predicted protein putative n=1 Tax=Albugo laibachii Nc14 TaxID=890382 RepID=F0WJ70_9STRA|nr:PREDICTED: similar to predicted protein putative [Albugo laibachii Nc14]|eukprot:CCA21317.1 PREDICTED: similar to predicted protein putative [Albugo laibachii Nc14]